MISSQSQVCVNVSHNSIIVRRRRSSKSSLNGKKVLSGVNKQEERRREAAAAVATRRKRQAEWEAAAGPAGQRGEESAVSKTWKKIRSERGEAKKKKRGWGWWLSVKQVGWGY